MHCCSRSDLSVGKNEQGIALLGVYLQFQASETILLLVQVNSFLALFFCLAGVIDLMEAILGCTDIAERPLA